MNPDVVASYAVWKEPDKVKGARIAWKRPRFVQRSWEMYHRDDYEKFTKKLIEENQQ